MSDLSQREDRVVVPRPRVLLATGDDELRRRLADWIGESYDVLECGSGEDALRLARDGAPDGALLDTSLPSLSGLGTAWVLKNDPHYGTVPVILMTSRHEPPDDPDSPDDRDFWSDSLADAVLEKPLDRTQLLRILAKRLPSERRGRSLPTPHDPWPERRMLPRQPVDIEARLSARGEEVSARVLSLSPRGAFIQSDCLLDPGVVAALSFPAQGGWFQGSCEVLYTADRGSCRGVGVQFQQLTPQSEACLLHTLG